MKKNILLLLATVIAISFMIPLQTVDDFKVLSAQSEPMSHWFMLHRRSNKEYLYHGIPGRVGQSQLIRTFDVKTGVPGKRPTPLPQLAGREYWVITAKRESNENPETAPYFLTLDIPYSEAEPFGPEPYLECGGQCNWELPGEFGLHGVNGKSEKLNNEDEGSSGCVRHNDDDISYLYNLLNPSSEQIRYFIEDK